VKLSRIKNSKNIDVSENTIKKYISKFFECIKIDDYKARKILIAEFLDKVIVSVDKVKIYFNIKFSFNGAPGDVPLVLNYRFLAADLDRTLFAA
jgi:hypothetical protein